MSFAQTQLEAVGITTSGKKGAEREVAALRIAQFQLALTSEMEAFKVANKDKPPTQSDIQSMINRLLLPAVIKTPGVMWGESEWRPNYLNGGGLFSTVKQMYVFDAMNRPDASRVDVVAEYNAIPIDLRRAITLDLQRDLGRAPSQKEVATRYEEVVLSGASTMPSASYVSSAGAASAATTSPTPIRTDQRGQTPAVGQPAVNVSAPDPASASSPGINRKDLLGFTPAERSRVMREQAARELGGSSLSVSPVMDILKAAQRWAQGSATDIQSFFQSAASGIRKGTRERKIHDYTTKYIRETPELKAEFDAFENRMKQAKTKMEEQAIGDDLARRWNEVQQEFLNGNDIDALPALHLR